MHRKNLGCEFDSSVCVYWWEISLFFPSGPANKDAFQNSFLQGGRILKKNKNGQAEKEDKSDKPQWGLFN